jgi:DNA repair protein RadC
MKILNSQTAFSYLHRVIGLETEEFWAVALKPNKAPLAGRCLFRGTVDYCLVHPRDIFRFACMTNASSLLVAHSHPSGDPMPSRQDKKLTHELLRAGLLMQIPIVDHIIITEDSYWSFADNGLIRSR